MNISSIVSPVQQVNISSFVIQGNKNFPNNGRLPLLILEKAISDQEKKSVEELLESNGWVNFWHDGILDYDHYHSTAHEVLVVTHGIARIQFGGPGGQTFSVSPGDVIIIPAGVAHRCLEHDKNFMVVGAYPRGQKYDMMEGKDNERPAADNRIKDVALPAADPIFGTDGPTTKHWT